MTPIDQNKKSLPIGEAFDLTSKLLIGSIDADQVGGLTLIDRARYQRDPAAFSKEVLDGDPYSRQIEIMTSVRDNPRTTVRSAHGVGKTWTAGDTILWFLNCFVPSTVVTTAPTARQVRDILWREVNVQYHKAKVPLGGRILTQQLIMSESQKWFATGFTTDEYSPDKFQGFHNTNMLVVIDEACGVPLNIYSAIEGLLSAGAVVRLLLIGNPTNEATEFGKSFKSPIYNKIHLSAFDLPNFTEFGITIEDIRTTREDENGRIVGDWQAKITGELPRPYLTTPQWVAERYLEWGEESPLFQVRVMGDFPEETEDTLIPLTWVERAQKMSFDPVGESILGVDIARFGTAESVRTHRHGGHVHPVKVWSHKSTMESAGIIKNDVDEIKPDVVNIDVIGVGAGVVDRLDEQGYQVNGVNVESTPEDITKFANLRAELYWTVREKLEKSEMDLPDDDLLASELTSFKYVYNSRGRLQLEPKKKTKERVGRSPDRADSLALTMYTKVERMSVAGDLSNIFSEQPNKPEVDLDKAVSNIESMAYNKDREECPTCHHKEGIEYFNESGMTDRVHAKFVRCLICNKDWEVIHDA